MPQLRDMQLADHAALLALMRATPGVVLRDADSIEATARYLARNPGLSIVAEHADSIVGCIMAGHDGRRGYLQHLLVHPDHRGQGLARRLVDECLARLAAQGIHKSHIDVLITNTEGAAFWQKLGWQLRSDIHRYSIVMNGNPNA